MAADVQISDPQAVNFVTATASNGVSLKLYPLNLIRIKGPGTTD